MAETGSSESKIEQIEKRGTDQGKTAIARALMRVFPGHGTGSCRRIRAAPSAKHFRVVCEP
jgi:hypothetical protein